MVESVNSASYIDLVEKYIYSLDCVLGNTTLGASDPHGLDYIVAAKCRETHIAIGMRSSLMLVVAAITTIAWTALFCNCLFYRYKKSSLQAIVDRKALTAEEVKKALHAEWTINNTKLLEEIKAEQKKLKGQQDQNKELERLKKVKSDYEELKNKTDDLSRTHLSLSTTFQSAADFNQTLVKEKGELINQLSAANAQVGQLAMAHISAGTLVRPNQSMESSKGVSHEGSLHTEGAESGGDSDAEDYLFESHQSSLHGEKKKSSPPTALPLKSITQN